LKINCVSFCSAASVGKITLEMNKEMHVDVSWQLWWQLNACYMIIWYIY